MQGTALTALPIRSCWGRGHRNAELWQVQIARSGLPATACGPACGGFRGGPGAIASLGSTGRRRARHRQQLAVRCAPHAPALTATPTLTRPPCRAARRRGSDTLACRGRCRDRVWIARRALCTRCVQTGLSVVDREPHATTRAISSSDEAPKPVRHGGDRAARPGGAAHRQPGTGRARKDERAAARRVRTGHWVHGQHQRLANERRRFEHVAAHRLGRLSSTLAGAHQWTRASQRVRARSCAPDQRTARSGRMPSFGCVEAAPR
jgi:hypothetical protein